MMNAEKHLKKLNQTKEKELDIIVGKLAAQFITLSDDKYNLTIAQRFESGEVLIYPFSIREESTWKIFYKKIGNLEVPISDFFSMVGGKGFREIYLEYDYPKVFLFDSMNDYRKNLEMFIRQEKISAEIKFEGDINNRLVRLD